ncbi:putative holin [Dyella sp. 2RAB6]|uniref:putative holin n=1 Tax=Dyella sp. 2RAB6 TaxID=3232992 RepID=UPI003F919744
MAEPTTTSTTLAGLAAAGVSVASLLPGMDGNAIVGAFAGAALMALHARDIGIPKRLAAAFAQGEAEHLGTFVRFVQGDPELHKALRGRKWAAFAKRYNGPAYADNLYDTKLTRAYARHIAVAAA